MKKLLLALFIAMPLVAGKQSLPESSPNKALSPQSTKALRAKERERKLRLKKHDENMRSMHNLPKNLFEDEIKRQQKRNAINNNQ